MIRKFGFVPADSEIDARGQQQHTRFRRGVAWSSHSRSTRHAPRILTRLRRAVAPGRFRTRSGHASSHGPGLRLSCADAASTASSCRCHRRTDRRDFSRGSSGPAAGRPSLQWEGPFGLEPLPRRPEGSRGRRVERPGWRARVQGRAPWLPVHERRVHELQADRRMAMGPRCRRPPREGAQQRRADESQRGAEAQGVPRADEAQLQAGNAGDLYGFWGMPLDGDPERRREAKATNCSATWWASGRRRPPRNPRASGTSTRSPWTVLRSSFSSTGRRSTRRGRHRHARAHRAAVRGRRDPLPARRDLADRQVASRGDEARLYRGPRFGIAASSAAGPVRGVSMCPRVTFACPPCGHMESASATHVLRLTTQNRSFRSTAPGPRMGSRRAAQWAWAPPRLSGHRRRAA